VDDRFLSITAKRGADIASAGAISDNLVEVSVVQRDGSLGLAPFFLFVY